MGLEQNLPKLLTTVVNSFVELCGCDGGSIFTLRKTAEGKPVLAFETMVTKSRNIRMVPERLKNLSFPLDGDSIVSHTAQTKQLTHISRGDPRLSSHKVDELLGYETYNMLSAPLITPRGDLVGVVQLINKLPYEKANPNDANIAPEFDARDLRLVQIVAGQAALAIENSLLLEEQEALLEGFVNACVTAVEARDVVTSGHSSRVCDFTVALADAVTRTTTGPLRGVNFSTNQIRELRYAAMLHDIGKIAVPEDVLGKEKKLFAWQLEVIRMRLKLMKSLLRQSKGADRAKIESEITKLNRAWEMITQANEPTVLPEAVNSALGELVQLSVKDEDGESFVALTPEESFKLTISKGSLTKEERTTIEQHVTNTYQILKMVPWSRGLENVAEIAYRHHEKLDGSGYPCKCPNHQIPVQSRLLTICDIFDALAADDRPYKKALTIEKSLDILSMEVREGKLDKDCFQVFLEAKVFDRLSRHRTHRDKKAA